MKRKMNKLLSILLALALMVGMSSTTMAAGGSVAFTDVPSNAWYYSDVLKAVNTGLINGYPDGTFGPNKNMTYAEAIKLAACMNQANRTGIVTLQNGSPWYQTYVDYAKANSIISKDYDWNSPATRAGYVEIFAHALPDSALAAKNSIADNAIPDVKITHPQAAEIYKLYRAGVLEGSTIGGVDNSFNPDGAIKRSEVSAILTRMMDVTARKSLTLGGGGEVTPPENGGGEVTPPENGGGEVTPPETDALKITAQPRNVTMTEGADVTFTVAASGGKAPYKYEWHRIAKSNSDTDAALIETATEVGTATPILTVKSCRVLDNGDRYYCMITDADGHKVISGQATLTVTTIPVSAPLTAVASPNNVTLNSGETFTATVNVSGGKAPYKYQWYVGTTSANTSGTGWGISNSSGSSTGSAYKHSVNLSQSTNDTANRYYYCRITDSNNNSINSNVLTVTWKKAAVSVPLTAVASPNNVSLNSGETFTATVTVSGGKAPYKYQWYVGTISANASGAGWGISNSSGSSTGSAYKHSVNMSQSTNDTANRYYYCRVTDSNNNSVNSNVLTVTWKKEVVPLKITTQPKNATVLVGGKATFSVVVTGGKTPYSYLWFWVDKNGDEGSFEGNGPVYTGQRTATMTYTPPDTTRSGRQYYCVITDADGQKVTSGKATVTITDPLRIAAHPKNVSVSEGWDATFSVTATGGTPPYRYEWHRVFNGKDEKLSDSAQFFYTDKAQMTVKSNARSHSGAQFYCVVIDQNSSTASDRATLTVK